MDGGIGVSGWDWTIFVSAVVLFLLLDLGVFHRKAHEVRFKEALAWSAVWFVLAFCFGLFIAPHMVENWTSVERDEFITGYIIELSLSFAFTFLVGVIVGTYSSIYIAAPLVLNWYKGEKPGLAQTSVVEEPVAARA